MFSSIPPTVFILTSGKGLLMEVASFWLGYSDVQHLKVPSEFSEKYLSICCPVGRAGLSAGGRDPGRGGAWNFTINSFLLVYIHVSCFSSAVSTSAVFQGLFLQRINAPSGGRGQLDAWLLRADGGPCGGLTVPAQTAAPRASRPRLISSFPGT